MAPDPIAVESAANTEVNYENGTTTLRGYLKDLLRTVWIEEEGFSGKRPFGNSGWQGDVEATLVKAGLVPGSLDEDGYLEDCDRKAAREMVLAVIELIFEERCCLVPRLWVMIDGQDYTRRCRVINAERHAGVNVYDMERLVDGERLFKVPASRITGHYVEM